MAETNHKIIYARVRLSKEEKRQLDKLTTHYKMSESQLLKALLKREFFKVLP